MFEPIFALLRSATLPRVVLLLNHVVASEPAAVARLTPWRGKTVGVELAELPAPLGFFSPATTPIVLQITPAGLFEVPDAAASATAMPFNADLRIRVDASNPLLSAVKAAAGERPDIRIEGDAALAGDISWLFDNLRWDMQDDLAKLIGPMAAHETAKVAGAIGAALRRMAGGVASVVSTMSAGRGSGSGGGPGPTTR